MTDGHWARIWTPVRPSLLSRRGIERGLAFGDPRVLKAELVPNGPYEPVQKDNRRRNFDADVLDVLTALVELLPKCSHLGYAIFRVGLPRLEA